MPYKKTHDMVVYTGRTYQDRQSGEEKSETINVGAGLKSEDGKFVLLLDRTFNPAGVPNPEGKTSVAINLFPIKPRQEQAPAPAPAK